MDSCTLNMILYITTCDAPPYSAKRVHFRLCTSSSSESFEPGSLVTAIYSIISVTFFSETAPELFGRYGG